jgi:hypothetical protein
METLVVKVLPQETVTHVVAVAEQALLVKTL